MRLIACLVLLALSLSSVYSDATCSIVGSWSSNDSMQEGAKNTAVFFSNESFAFTITMMNCTFQLTGQYQILSESDNEVSLSLDNQPVACNILPPITPICSVIY